MHELRALVFLSRVGEHRRGFDAFGGEEARGLGRFLQDLSASIEVRLRYFEWYTR
ncbi:MAG: hypothetical protein Q8L52_01555 [bacterium]|nr:hypothetical protein [bacterium]